MKKFLATFCLLTITLGLLGVSGVLPDWKNIQGKPYISVKDPPFRAIGNGVTDDTNSIKAAIASAAAVHGATVYFPRGVYKVTDTIFVDHTGLQDPAVATGLVGLGVCSLEGTNRNDSVIWLSTASDVPAVKIGGSNVSVKNLGVVCSNAGVNDAIHVTPGTGGQVSNVTIQNCDVLSNRYGIRAQQTTGLIIDTCGSFYGQGFASAPLNIKVASVAYPSAHASSSFIFLDGTSGSIPGFNTITTINKCNDIAFRNRIVANSLDNTAYQLGPLNITNSVLQGHQEYGIYISSLVNTLAGPVNIQGNYMGESPENASFMIYAKNARLLSIKDNYFSNGVPNEYRYAIYISGCLTSISGNTEIDHLIIGDQSDLDINNQICYAFDCYAGPDRVRIRGRNFTCSLYDVGKVDFGPNGRQETTGVSSHTPFSPTQTPQPGYPYVMQGDIHWFTDWRPGNNQGWYCASAGYFTPAVQTVGTTATGPFFADYFHTGGPLQFQVVVTKAGGIDEAEYRTYYSNTGTAPWTLTATHTLYPDYDKVARRFNTPIYKWGTLRWYSDTNVQVGDTWIATAVPPIPAYLPVNP